jgi:hypothetical protein
MALAPIFGGQQTTFGGSLNMDNGVGFVFLTRSDFGGNKPPDDKTIETQGKLGVTKASKGIKGLIVQQLDIQAARPLSTFYDISSTNVYYVAGKSTAQVGLNRIVGPKGLILDYYKQFGDPCNAPYNFMYVDLSKSACDEQGKTVAATKSSLCVRNCILSNITISVSVQNFVITEAGQITGSQLLTVT